MSENAFEIVVNQQPGEITWNYETLKTALADKMSEYRDVVYTDDKIKDAKADRAELRKLAKALDGKRKEIKDACLAPYQIIEQQASELKGLIEAPINEIDRQVKEYEEKQRREKAEQICLYMEEAFKNLPSELASRLRAKIYDTRWENATTSKKTYEDAIDQAAEQTHKELAAIEDIEEDLRDEVYKTYERNLVLADALEKANELRKQKQRILEAERARREAEEKRKAEEARRAAEAAKSEPVKEPEPEMRVNTPHVPSNESETPKLNNDTPTSTEPVTERIRHDDGHYMIIIEATPAQYKKITGYIEFTGAKFEEVSA